MLIVFRDVLHSDSYCSYSKSFNIIYIFKTGFPTFFILCFLRNPYLLKELIVPARKCSEIILFSSRRNCLYLTLYCSSFLHPFQNSEHATVVLNSKEPMSQFKNTSSASNKCQAGYKRDTYSHSYKVSVTSHEAKSRLTVGLL